MLRFITITNKLKDAVFDFFMEQDECKYEYMDEEIRHMLDTAFSELRRIKTGVLPVTVINRYDLTIRNGSKDIMLPGAEDNGVLSCEAVHLASIQIDECVSDDEEKTIERGYDIIYDVGGDVVIPVYTITVSDKQMTSVYRVECDYIEDFHTMEFIISLSIQLADRLMNAREFLVKACDLPCA